MRLDSIQDGPDKRPMVRLYQFDFKDVQGLFDGLKALASREDDILEVHGMGGVEPIGGTQFLLRSGSKNKGMLAGIGVASFECVLTPESWDHVTGLV